MDNLVVRIHNFENYRFVFALRCSISSRISFILAIINCWNFSNSFFKLTASKRVFKGDFSVFSPSSPELKRVFPNKYEEGVVLICLKIGPSSVRLWCGGDQRSRAFYSITECLKRGPSSSRL